MDIPEKKQEAEQSPKKVALNFTNNSKKHLENDFADKYIVIKAANMVRAKMGMPPMTEEEIKKYVY